MRSTRCPSRVSVSSSLARPSGHDLSCLRSSCNFESDMCSFTNLYNANLRFERTRAFQLINDYAPDRDHTLNNVAGSFIYVDTFDQPADRTAQLRSATFSSTPGCKVRFHYYMNSPTIPGQLTFMIRTQTFGPASYLWSTNKILGDYWERQELLLPTGSLYDLLIEVKSSSGGGIIALDDISFSSECNRSTGFLPYGTTLKPNGTTTTPTTCTYTCQDGTCVGKDKVRTIVLRERTRQENTMMFLALQFCTGLLWRRR